jgi:hypothetical protein
MPHQLTDTVLMIEPTYFSFNEKAAETNTFQNKVSESDENIRKLVIKEFHAGVKALKDLGVNVITFTDTKEPHTPDAVFPNNWISTHETGDIYLYPMQPESRRAERRTDIVNHLKESFGFQKVHDWSAFEKENQFLEGTGSLVLDRKHQKMYAALSERTHPGLVKKLSREWGYEPIMFTAFGHDAVPIYHTNVVMSVGDGFAAVGLDVMSEGYAQKVKESLMNDGHDVIALTKNQVLENFAGNMLCLKNEKGERILALSETAFLSLTDDQKQQVEKHIDHWTVLSIPIIEEVGGGSVRCMLAEIFHS